MRSLSKDLAEKEGRTTWSQGRGQVPGGKRDRPSGNGVVSFSAGGRCEMKTAFRVAEASRGILDDGDRSNVFPLTTISRSIESPRSF